MVEDRKRHKTSIEQPNEQTNKAKNHQTNRTPQKTSPSKSKKRNGAIMNKNKKKRKKQASKHHEEARAKRAKQPAAWCRKGHIKTNKEDKTPNKHKLATTENISERPHQRKPPEPQLTAYDTKNPPTTEVKKGIQEASNTPHRTTETQHKTQQKTTPTTHAQKNQTTGKKPAKNAEREHKSWRRTTT